MENQKIRDYAKTNNVCLWMVADYLKISVSKMTRMLRYKLSKEDEHKIRNAVDVLKRK